ncbi:Acg family FMN-binding oxidoreductase [Paractinoplanes durhamensis]|uniref:Acg family FMN-binding oxidoreductase n=1 Tax=Paractinoplanes durhamensis TaxID=113563 RepID=UPI0036379AB8
MNASVHLLPHSEARAALEAAARASLRAPSVFNTQPWAWRISGQVMELSADPARRLAVTDATGRLMRISCGAALHHARVALAAAGWSAGVERMPDARRPDLLARIRVTGLAEPDMAAIRLAEAIIRRRTDRRAYGDRRIPPKTFARLAELAEAEGVRLHLVPEERVPELAVAVDEAADVEYFNPAFRSELSRWTHRPAWTGDGVPPSTVVQPTMRRVPARNFLPGGTAGLAAGSGGDEGARTSSSPAPAISPCTCCAAGRRCPRCCCTPPPRASRPPRSARRSRCPGRTGCCAASCRGPATPT